jgi:hypothetical protein
MGMKKLGLLLILVSAISDAQMIVYQQVERVSPYPFPVYNTSYNADYYAAQKYGSRFTSLNQVPLQQKPVDIIREYRPVIIPTASADSNLPGQTADDVVKMQQLTK